MIGFINKKRWLVFLCLFIMALIGYYFLWVGESESYQINALEEVEEKCYKYKSNEDVKNIARHEIIRLYGGDALNEQRKLNVFYIKHSNEIAVGGRPYGILKAAYLYFFAQDYLTPLTVILIYQPKNKCASIESALYQKN